MNPVTVGYRIDGVDPGHTVISVFVGSTPGARGHAGTLTFRTSELFAFANAGVITLRMEPIE